MLIGIAGPSGSGKTALARQLLRALPGTSSLLSLDSYYKRLSHLPVEERSKVNFDHPSAVDWDLFLDHLDRLSRGETVAEPVYRFAEHDRAAETVAVLAAGYVLIEGILVLHRPDVRERLGLSVYVETPDRVCFARRLFRDTVERGRTGESVYRQYEETVLPMAERYVWPARDLADVIVSGEEPFDNSVARVVAALGVNATRPSADRAQ